MNRILLVLVALLLLSVAPSAHASHPGEAGGAGEACVISDFIKIAGLIEAGPIYACIQAPASAAADQDFLVSATLNGPPLLSAFYTLTYTDGNAIGCTVADVTTNTVSGANAISSYSIWRATPTADQCSFTVILNLDVGLVPAQVFTTAFVVNVGTNDELTIASWPALNATILSWPSILNASVTGSIDTALSGNLNVSGFELNQTLGSLNVTNEVDAGGAAQQEIVDWWLPFIFLTLGFVAVWHRGLNKHPVWGLALFVLLLGALSLLIGDYLPPELDMPFPFVALGLMLVATLIYVAWGAGFKTFLQNKQDSDNE